MSYAFYDEETLGKAYDMRLIRRLLPYLAPHRALLSVAGLFTLLRIPLEIVRSLLVGVAVALLSAEAIPDNLAWLASALGAPEATLGGVPSDAALLWVVTAMLAVLFTWAVIEAGRMFAMRIAGQRSLLAIRSELFAHVQRLPMGFFDHYPVGRLVTRLTNDPENTGEMFASGLIHLIADILLMIVIAGVLFWFDWRITLATLAIVPPVAFAMLLFRLKVREAYREGRIQVARLNAHLQETVTGMKIIQLFARETRNLRDYSETNRAHRDAWFRSIRFDALLFSTLGLAESVALAIIVWFGAKLAVGAEVSLVTDAVFIVMLQLFLRPLLDLGAKYSIMQSAMASLERMFELLDRIPEPPVRDRQTVPAAAGEIVFDGVSFAYDDEPVLRDVSFRVAPGERVAFVGATGSGKTTVLKLLARLYEIKEGSIRVDSVDIRDYPRQDLRRLLAFVLQDVFLFTGTLEYNIGLERASGAEIADATRTAHVDPLIERLQDGLQQAVKERGVNFSAGERQLLSFARALAQRPEILLLDEATSSVDTETEALIQDALHRMMQGKTSIVVAHRLSTIRDVDRIYVMHNGEIREVGDHDQLLERRGLYWKLYQLQYAPQEAA